MAVGILTTVTQIECMQVLSADFLQDTPAVQYVLQRMQKA